MQQNVYHAEAKVTGTRRRVFIMISASTCTRGTKKLDNRTISWIKCGRWGKVTTPRRWIWTVTSNNSWIRRNKRGGTDRQKKPGSVQKKKTTTRDREDFRSEPKGGKKSDPGSRVVLLREMMVLQDVSVLTSTYVKDWQYKDILNDIDNLAWEDLSEEWCAHISERRESPALWNLSQPSKTFPWGRWWTCEGWPASKVWCKQWKVKVPSKCGLILGTRIWKTLGVYTWCMVVNHRSLR